MQPTMFEFADTPLSDVVDFFAAQFEINIQLDNKGLADAAVDPSAPITRTIRNPVSLEASLRLILEDLDLTFVIQDEVLKITSKEKADEILTSRVYPVSDLIGAHHNYGPLMTLIRNTIQPDTWEDNGGPGSVQPFSPGEVLVISQTWAVHEEIVDLFVELRRVLARYPHTLDVRPPRNAYTRRVRPVVSDVSVVRLGGGGGRLGGGVFVEPPDPSAAFTTNREGLQVVSGLYGANCRVRAGNEAPGLSRLSSSTQPASGDFGGLFSVP